MVQPVKRITFLNQAQEPVLKYIGENIPGCEGIKHLDKIEIDPELDPKIKSTEQAENELPKPQAVLQKEKLDTPVVLKLNTVKGKEVFKALQEIDGVKDKEGEAYVIDAKDKFLGFTEHEEAVQSTLKTVSDILDRAYNRRTNVSCWILFLYLRYFGFKKDDYEPVRSILTYDPNDPQKSTDFVRKFAKYLKLKKEDKARAEEFVNSAFDGDSEKEKKLGLVKLSCFVMNSSNKLPQGFLNKFPLVFAIQNLAMPILANLVKTGFWGNLFHYMRMINPWVCDFLAEQVANFKAEIFKVQNSIESINDPFKDDKTEIEADGKDVIDEVRFTDLDKEQYGLKKVVGYVNDAFDRFFGRQTTLASWILHGVLWLFGTDYKSFASQFTEDSGFVKNLCEHLKLAKVSADTKQNEPELSKNKFQKPGQLIVAKIILGVVSIANALKPSTIKKITNVFGCAFSIQNLFMPILSEFVKKGKIATCVHILRDINPLLNDILDYFANYRKEILDVQRENKKIEGLLPVLKKDQMFKAATRNIKTLWTSIREFGSKVFGRHEVTTT